MKKVLFIILILVFIISLSIYIAINRDQIVYIYMLYDHIRYNGSDYYLSENQSYTPSNEGELRGPVYLLNKSGKVISKNTYYAYVYKGYKGEEDEIYLFFDSAGYIRSDYLTKND